MSINRVTILDALIKLQTILISVSDKTDLDYLVPALLEINPLLRIFSTGGTFTKIQEIIGANWAKNLMKVDRYTGQPETKGGLVKTLDFKIYLGLLTETYNESHQADLKRTGATPIDMIVGNLYPFGATVEQIKAGKKIYEDGRGNIDIGGPCMIRASAKNWLRVISAIDPTDYPSIIDNLKANNGCSTAKFRYGLVAKAFRHISKYDEAIADYHDETSFEEAIQSYGTINP